MSLPRPQIDPSVPIPNNPFQAEEVYYLETNQGSVPLGEGLYINPATGGFTNIRPLPPSPYCSPAYPDLPPSSPPFGCNTEVNTSGVTDFSYAWQGCTSIIDFPCVDSSTVINFTYAWGFCENMVSFPNIDTSQGTDFTRAWAYCFYMQTFPALDFSSGTDFSHSWAYNYALTPFPEVDISNGSVFYYSWAGCYSLTSFPALDLSKGEDFGGSWVWCKELTSFGSVDVSSGRNFDGTWRGCSNLTSFPQLDVSKGTSFYSTWRDCTGLTTFPAGMFDNCLATNFVYAWQFCALSQQSVDNILVSLDTAGQSNGTVDLSEGTSSAPGTAGATAKANLQTRGWTVITN